MNRAEELCHSSGPWKKHKYFKKIGEGANADYKYAKDNVAGRVTGDYYDKKAKEFEDEAEDIEQERYRLQDSVIKSASNNHNIKQDKLRKANEAYIEEGVRKHGELNDQQIAAESTARRFRRKAENSIGEKVTGKRAKAQMDAAEKRLKETDKLTDYWAYNKAEKKYNKTAAGVVSKASEAISRGQAKINKLFKSETKVTIKDTFTGETRTPSKPKNAADTINIKQLSDKNKKRKK